VTIFEVDARSRFSVRRRKNGFFFGGQQAGTEVRGEKRKVTLLFFLENNLVKLSSKSQT